MRILAFCVSEMRKKCATKCAIRYGFLGLLSVLYSSFIVFINQSHSGGFCPSSGLIKCEAKPQQALFADFLEGGKQTTYLYGPFQQRLKTRGTINGGIAQLARALAWHARGPGFESPYLHNNRTVRSPRTVFFYGSVVQWIE